MGTSGYLWVPTGTHWYLPVPTGTCRYLLVPASTHWYPGTCRYLPVPTSTLVPAFPKWLPLLTDQTKMEALLSLAPGVSSSVIGPAHNLSQSQPSISNFKQFPKSKFLQALGILLQGVRWEKQADRKLAHFGDLANFVR